MGHLRSPSPQGAMSPTCLTLSSCCIPAITCHHSNHQHDEDISIMNKLMNNQTSTTAPTNATTKVGLEQYHHQHHSTKMTKAYQPPSSRGLLTTKHTAHHEIQLCISSCSSLCRVLTLATGTSHDAFPSQLESLTATHMCEVLESLPAPPYLEEQWNTIYWV